MILDYKNNENSLIGKVYELPKDNNGDIIKFDIENFTEIQEDEIFRIDKLAKRVFNDENSWDKLSKINGIQDPFILDNSHVFIVLSYNYMNTIFKKSNELLLTSNKSLITNSRIENTVINTDLGRQERISKILYKFGEVPTELRKPIYLRTNEQNLQVSDGVIVV